MKKSGKVENPRSARSNKDSKKIPSIQNCLFFSMFELRFNFYIFEFLVHLRDFEDSEDSEADTDDVTEIKTHKSVKSEYDFYN